MLRYIWALNVEASTTAVIWGDLSTALSELEQERQYAQGKIHSVVTLRAIEWNTLLLRCMDADLSWVCVCDASRLSFRTCYSEQLPVRMVTGNGSYVPYAGV